MATKKQDLDFNKNEDGMKQLISQMKRRLEKVYLGGGQKRIDKQHASGKMTARERVKALLDADKPQKPRFSKNRKALNSETQEQYSDSAEKS